MKTMKQIQGQIKKTEEKKARLYQEFLKAKEDKLELTRADILMSIDVHATCLPMDKMNNELLELFDDYYSCTSDDDDELVALLDNIEQSIEE